MTINQSYLVHHGIFGQKWGVRRFQNPDGSLTEAGKDRYQKKVITDIKKNMSKLKDKYDVNRDVKVTAEIHKDLKQLLSRKDVQYAKDEVNKANKEYTNFINNEKLRDEYATYSGIINAKHYANDPNDEEEVKSFVWGSKYDDLDQGDGNSFSLYLLDKGTNILDYGAKVNKAYDNYREKVKDLVKGYLGSHSNDPIETYTATGYTLTGQKVLESAMKELDGVDSWYDGHMNYNEISQYKKELAEAKKEYYKYKDV